MSTLAPFQYGEQDVRAFLVDDEPWFVAADVARILGYATAKDMTRRLDDEDKGGRSVPTPGGAQRMTVISEPGLYVAVLGSQVEGARAFKRWITHEVLPALRKTGTYSVAPALPQDYASALRELAASVEAQQIAEATIAEQAPKVAAWDAIVSSAGSWSYNDAAKVITDEGEVEIGEKRLVARLVEWGYLYRDHKKRPHVYQQFLAQGLFAVKARTYTDLTTGETRESSAPQVRITGKGLQMIRTRLTAKEIAA